MMNCAKKKAMSIKTQLGTKPLELKTTSALKIRTKSVATSKKVPNLEDNPSLLAR